MKKQFKRVWLPVMLVLVMALVAVPMLLHAAAEEPFHTAHDVKWETTGGELSGGNYYLDADVQASSFITVKGTVNLCLNGHTLNMGSYSIRPADGAVINICDCSAGEHGKIVSANYPFWPDSYYKNSGDINVYGGTLQGLAAVCNQGAGSVTVYGGKLIGQKGIENNQTGSVVIYGGAVSSTVGEAIINNGTLVIQGGTIESANNVAIRLQGASSSIALSGAPVIHGGANRDDIVLAATSKLQITAPLTYGTDDLLSVYVANATYPCTFTEGWSAQMGGHSFSDFFAGSSLYAGEYKLRLGADGELHFTEHMHTWLYTVVGNELTVTCTPDEDMGGDGLNCALPGLMGGSVTLSVGNSVYNAQPVFATVQDTTVFGATVSAVTYERWNGSSWVSCGEPVAVGSYRALLTVTEEDGVTEHPLVAAFEIAYLDTADAAKISGDSMTVAGEIWYKGDVTFAAPAGYTICATLDGVYADSIVLTEDMNGDFVYYLKNASGYIAEKTVEVRRDTVGPRVDGMTAGTVTDTTFAITGVDAWDSIGIREYQISYWQIGDELNKQTATSLDGSFSLSGLSANTEYGYALTATDVLGHASTVAYTAQFKTEKTSLSGAVITVNGSFVYTGSAIEPTAVTVALNGVTLDRGQYTISYENNTVAGNEAKLIVEAVAGGDYSGSEFVYFTISPRSLNTVSASLSGTAFTYNGSEQKPTLLISANGTPLVEGVDYTVSYLRGAVATTDLTNAAEGSGITVCLFGHGNYAGEKTVGTYVIQKAKLRISAKEQILRAGENLLLGLGQVNIVGLAAGDEITSVALWQEGHYVKCGSAVFAKAGADANYVVEYHDALCHTLDWNPTTSKLTCTYPGCSVMGHEEDTVAPTGTLTVTAGRYTATTTGFHATVPFGLFTNASLTVTVNATDALSGLKNIEIYISDVARTQDELRSLYGWHTYTNGGVTIDAQNGKQVIVYIRLTDRAGNVAYLSFDRGITFDLSLPEVKGIVSGETYYVTQKFTLADLGSGISLKNVVGCPWSLVDLEGQNEALVTLAGDRAAVYQFALYDAVGNAAVNGTEEGGAGFVIIMKPISTLADPIAHLTIHNVTGRDAATLRAVRAKVVGIDTTYATAGEKAALQDILTKCDQLLAKVQNVEELLVQIEDMLAGYDIDTVTSADRAAIALIADDITALEANNDLTPEQEAEIVPLREKAAALLQRIDEVAAAISHVKTEMAGYDIATVTKQDRAALQELLAATNGLLAGNNLTIIERSDLASIRLSLIAMLDKIVDIEAEIQRIAEELAKYSKNTVKSSDKVDIEDIVLAIDDLLGSFGITTAERQSLADLRETALALLDKIASVAEEIARLAGETGKYQLDTVTSLEHSALQQLMMDFSAILNGDNLTTDERNDVIAMRVLASTFLGRLDMIREETNRIAAAIDGYDPAKIGLADRKNVLQLIDDLDDLLSYPNHIEEERAALEALQERARALLTNIEENSNNHTAILDQLYAYEIDTVRTTDKADILRIRAEIEALLATDKLSARDRAALEEGLVYADELLAEIDRILAELTRLILAVARYDVTTVKSSDRAAIEQLIGEMDALIASDRLTDVEKESLQPAREKAIALIARLDEAAAARNTENIQAAGQITQENFNLSDRETLEQAKQEMEKALADYDGNYTEEEKKAMRDEIARYDAVLLSIKRVETLQAALDSLPEVGRYNPNDSETNQLIEAIQTALGQLTDRERELVDTGRLDAILASLADYKIIAGNGASWLKGSDFSLSFQANGPYEKFTGVMIDGVMLPRENYHSFDRDTVVNLLPAYLETLEAGEHTITILYVEDEAEGTFTITVPSDNGNGGSYLWLLIVIIVLCLAGGGVAVYFVMKKERQKDENE